MGGDEGQRGRGDDRPLTPRQFDDLPAGQPGQPGQMGPMRGMMRAQPNRAQLEQQIRNRIGDRLKKGLSLSDEQFTKLQATNKRFEEKRRLLVEHHGEERAFDLTIRARNTKPHARPGASEACASRGETCSTRPGSWAARRCQGAAVKRASADGNVR